MPNFTTSISIIWHAEFRAKRRIESSTNASKDTITAHANDIAAAGLKATKTGVTFTPRKPIPDELVQKLALASRKELGF
jgi:hypothetical protein